MTTVSPRARAATGPHHPAAELPRLIASPPAPSLAAHLDRLGPLPRAGRRTGGTLIDATEAAGLRGRGGAGFPTATKLAAVVRAAGRRSLVGQRRPVVVANGLEGEPASIKDATLLSHAPHLVLDGIVAAALAVGASDAVLCVDRERAGVIAIVERALAERERSGTDPLPIGLAAAPSRYVSGEESALVHWLNGGEARPTTVAPRPFERGVAARPTLVDNVETLAHLALIARFGPAWWRTVGTAEAPGSLLLTITDGHRSRSVFEVPQGLELGGLLDRAGVTATGDVLIGGYFGTWLRRDEVAGLRLMPGDLARFGASLGCGAIAVLPSNVCPLEEVARVTSWLAGETAGQCGACAHGLPAIAGAVGALVDGDGAGRARADLARWIPMVGGRGACKMPDGALRFVSSALRVFEEHRELHRYGSCAWVGAHAVLPVPRHGGGWQ